MLRGIATECIEQLGRDAVFATRIARALAQQAQDAAGLEPIWRMGAMLDSECVEAVRTPHTHAMLVVVCCLLLLDHSQGPLAPSFS